MNTLELETILTPVREMPVIDQLAFWCRFRTVHRARIAKTEAALCPEVLAAVDTLIADLRNRAVKGE